VWGVQFLRGGGGGKSHQIQFIILVALPLPLKEERGRGGGVVGGWEGGIVSDTASGLYSISVPG
jgi:hypothetical protein